MASVKRRFLGLCLPPLAFAALDGTLTLTGQSAEYWSGAYSRVNEASPTFHELLAIHPLAFVAGLIGFSAVFVSIILLLPDTLALIMSIAATLGHTIGAATWILWRYEFGYQACNALFLLSAILVGLGIRWGWQAGPPDEYRLPASLAKWRWVLSGILFAIGLYIALWPRRV